MLFLHRRIHKAHSCFLPSSVDRRTERELCDETQIFLKPLLTLFCHSGIFPRISGITANVKSTFQPGLTEERYYHSSVGERN